MFGWTYCFWWGGDNLDLDTGGEVAPLVLTATTLLTATTDMGDFE